MYDFIPRGNGNWPGCHGSEDPASSHARLARFTAHSQRTDKVNQRAVFRVFETSPARKQRDIRPEHLAGCHVVVRHDGRLALNTHGGLAEPLRGGCREAMAAASRANGTQTHRFVLPYNRQHLHLTGWALHRIASATAPRDPTTIDDDLDTEPCRKPHTRVLVSASGRCRAVYTLPFVGYKRREHHES